MPEKYANYSSYNDPKEERNLDSFYFATRKPFAFDQLSSLFISWIHTYYYDYAWISKWWMNESINMIFAHTEYWKYMNENQSQTVSIYQSIFKRVRGLLIQLSKLKGFEICGLIMSVESVLLIRPARFHPQWTCFLSSLWGGDPHILHLVEYPFSNRSRSGNNKLLDGKSSITNH